MEKKFWLPFLVVIVLVIVGLALFFFKPWDRPNSSLSSDEPIYEEELSDEYLTQYHLSEEVADLVNLSRDERGAWVANSVCDQLADKSFDCSFSLEEGISNRHGPVAIWANYYLYLLTNVPDYLAVVESGLDLYSRADGIGSIQTDLPSCFFMKDLIFDQSGKLSAAAKERAFLVCARTMNSAFGDLADQTLDRVAAIEADFPIVNMNLYKEELQAKYDIFAARGDAETPAIAQELARAVALSANSSPASILPTAAQLADYQLISNQIDLDIYQDSLLTGALAKSLL